MLKMVKRCAFEPCSAQFRPHQKSQRWCSRSCAIKGDPEKSRNGSKAAAEARKREGLRTIVLELRERFGELTPRDLEIAKMMRRNGYKAGWLSGYRKMRREEAA